MFPIGRTEAPGSVKMDRAGLAPQMAVFFLFFGLVSAAMNWFFIRKDLAASKWPSVEGRIVSSSIASGLRSGKGVSSRWYRPSVSYEFQVGGASPAFKGTEISSIITSSTDEGWARSVIASYPTGAKVRVFYNPENPSEALLEVDPDWFHHASMLLVTFLFLALGLALFWFRHRIDGT